MEIDSAMAFGSAEAAEAMAAPNADALVSAHNAFVEAFVLAINVAVKVLSGSQAEFWGAPKLPNSRRTIAMGP